MPALHATEDVIVDSDGETWHVYETEDGVAYYWSPSTQESRWDRPL